MKRPKIKVGDTVELIDIEGPNFPLVAITITEVVDEPQVYGSVVEPVYVGFSSSGTQREGGKEFRFTLDVVISLNGELVATKAEVIALLEYNLNAGCTKLSMFQQMQILGVLKSYAN